MYFSLVCLVLLVINSCLVHYSSSVATLNLFPNFSLQLPCFNLNLLSVLKPKTNIQLFCSFPGSDWVSGKLKYLNLEGYSRDLSPK